MGSVAYLICPFVDMATASMDALGAFSHLQSNLPAWITRVSELAAHTSAKHAEYLEAYRRHASLKPRRRKNSSVCSIHTDDLVPIAQREGPPPEAVENTTNASTPAQHAGRKRGTDEAPSIDSSDRYAFVSTRHNMIIEYDGHTQKVLEQVVRDIGVARNNIRRGKMSMMPRAGMRSSLLNKTVNIGSNNTSGGESQLPSLACVRSTRTGPGVVGVSGSQTSIRKESPLDFADKQLELAYGLCETAAYQVLRSGDCGTELDGVEEKFKMLLEATTHEVNRLQQEKSQRQAQADVPTEKTPEKPPPTSSAARLARMRAITNANHEPSDDDPGDKPGAIEVDDASSLSAESIDLSVFRSSRVRV